MVTTIQVGEDTLEILKHLRSAYEAKSYDEALRRALDELTRRESLAGILKHIPREELQEGLRDEHDRF
jgi:hypothetical protein